MFNYYRVTAVTLETEKKSLNITLRAKPGVTSHVILPPMSIETFGVEHLSSMHEATHVNSRQWMHLVGVRPPKGPSMTRTRHNRRHASLKFTPKSNRDVCGRKVKGVLLLSLIHWCFLKLKVKMRLNSRIEPIPYIKFSVYKRPLLH